MVPLRTVFAARFRLELGQEQQMEVPALRFLVAGVMELTMFAHAAAPLPPAWPWQWIQGIGPHHEPIPSRR